MFTTDRVGRGDWPSGATPRYAERYPLGRRKTQGNAHQEIALTGLIKLVLIGVALAMALQLAEIHQQQEFLSWAIVSLNQENQANGGRFLALETLMLFGSNLSGLNLQDAVLPKIDLSQASMMKADFERAT